MELSKRVPDRKTHVRIGIWRYLSVSWSGGRAPSFKPAGDKVKVGPKSSHLIHSGGGTSHRGTTAPPRIE